MRHVLAVFAVAAAAASLAQPGVAEAKGCLKGAAVGGVAGHVAGHHGLIGAAAGCAIEHHREKVRDRDATRAAHPSGGEPAEPRTDRDVRPASDGAKTTTH